LHATVLQQHIERSHEFNVPIVHQISLAQHKSVNRIRQLPGALPHEGHSEMRANPGKMICNRTLDGMA
jgi:hypothetical protein